MQYRTLGKTGLSVSEIGYGGGRVRPEHDEKSLVNMIHYAIDCGLNFIDTAPNYGGGYSETVIGKAITDRRDACIVATKTEAYDPDGIAADVEGSLQRLRTDYIDVLQFHGGWFYAKETEQILNGGGLEKYLKLKKEGKVRFIGFSANGPSGGTEQLIAAGQFDMMQIHYNLMYQSTCDTFGRRGVIPDAVEQDMGIVLMRSTTSNVFQNLMKHCFPNEMAAVNVDSFLLNYSLSNPMVNVALMSLQSTDDVNWTNAVSDDVEARLDLRAIHGR
ncbi:MAG: aldo/keto reductase [Candidatus Poribacteria bacterium]|nr:aldo/keto reductase [Candidatus Poribacteria bacterium]